MTFISGRGGGRGTLPNVKFGYSKQAPHKKAHYNFLKVTSASNLGLFCHKVALDVRLMKFFI